MAIRQLEAAEARCAQLEDDLDRERDNHAALLRINQHAAEEWEARCARLQQALREYGVHKESCPFVGWDDDVCTCGFREALAELNKEQS